MQIVGSSVCIGPILRRHSSTPGLFRPLVGPPRHLSESVHLNPWGTKPNVNQRIRPDIFGSLYTILSVTREKVEEYFDLKPGGSGFDPLPVGDSAPNPLQPKPSGSNGSGQSVEDQGDSRALAAKAKNQSMNGSTGRAIKGSGKKPLDPLPGGILTNLQLVQRAIDAGCTDVDQIIDWVPKNHHTKVGRRDAERWFKHLQRLDFSEQ